MAQMEKRESIRRFIMKWRGKGKEHQDDQSFWIDLLHDVLGVEHPTDHIQFQKTVIVDGNTKFIDAYIPETKVLIEQKSFGIRLDKKIPQSGGIELTPYEQAKRYKDNLPSSEVPRWIITSNFEEIWVYDMDQKVPAPQKFEIDNLRSQYSLLNFLVDNKVKQIDAEMELSLKAGELVGKIHDRFLEQYHDPMAKKTQNSLNVLCVRLVFCLYAEDAGLFGPNRDEFSKYIGQYEPKDVRQALLTLFRVLDTPAEERADLYLDEELERFPYVNGGLFANENIVIPKITEEIKQTLEESSHFDWSMISPTIFGAVFESTLNPETRRAGGMHYTSIENIHKVIDPLFLDDLKTEFEAIREIAEWKTKKKKLLEFQEKLASLKFFDPACGSGNFLTETFVSIRRLENRVLLELNRDQISFADENFTPIRVSISQFYGIEINDFAVVVAKTALWIAESQMMQETESVVKMSLDFLPLKTNANIIEGNALRLDWSKVVGNTENLFCYGNPPFLGYSMQSSEQKEDILSIYVDEKGRPYRTAGKIDYVAGWYFKASQMMQGTGIRTAFVSTNSITQGEQVASVWKPLLIRFGVHIDFAWRTFRWDSEASDKAHVHCVIVGFSSGPDILPKKVFTDEQETIVTHINPYLIEAPDILIESRNKPICNVHEMSSGNRPADGGFLIIEEKEFDDFIQKDPESKKYLKRLSGATEFINNKKRWCLWLVGVSPSEIRKMPEVMKRVELCRQDRLNGAEDRQKLALTPTLFRETNNPESAIVIPRHSSENRRYIPLGFIGKEMILTDAAMCIPDASIYEFGILTSNVHMAWMRVVCGRIKSDYRYSKDIVYNNFPWPEPTEEQKAKIEQTAQGILDARAKYPDSSLADLYDPLTMPPELRKAHEANDRAVMQAYGFNIKEMSEADCVAELMRMYQDLAEKKG
ncbi:MAG: class I SAM-dependent DNA methyltransferase [Flexilinea sp.]|nr:class I SAM-dependent DNA methyltransferase [Flexilinea sp.]